MGLFGNILDVVTSTAKIPVSMVDDTVETVLGKDREVSNTEKSFDDFEKGVDKLFDD